MTSRSRPNAERQSARSTGATTIEVPANHMAMVSHPDEVAHLIETAAKTIQAEIKWSGRLGRAGFPG